MASQRRDQADSQQPDTEHGERSRFRNRGERGGFGAVEADRRARRPEPALWQQPLLASGWGRKHERQWRVRIATDCRQQKVTRNIVERISI